MERDPHFEALPHVVIIGGGFGGLYAARALRKAPVRVTVIDRRNHHLFQPLLYQVATAVLSPADIAAPIRHVLRHDDRTRVLLAEVVDIDTQGRAVVLGDGYRIGYDSLIVAAGATHHYFGHAEWEAVAPGLKTIEDATAIRGHYLMAFERAEQEPDPERRRALLTFVVIGAGPTGVEMAGSMAETAHHTLRHDFRHIDPSLARILLLEGGPRVLPAYAPELSEKAAASLRDLGVEVRTGSIVTGVDEDAVYVGEERIPTRNVIWAAGVTASPLGRTLGVPTDKAGRVIVGPDLSIPGHPEVFVIGDLAVARGSDGAPLPGVAQVAMQEGRAVAANLRRELRGEPREPFRYNDRGSMATIGRFRAIAEIGRWKLSGFAAWFVWVFIHIAYLSGFRNRLVVMTEWAYSFFSWQRGARLITRPAVREAPATPESRDAHAAVRGGQTVPPDGESPGWMSGDAQQARG